MFKPLIVPVDGSADSWRAFDVALALGRRCDRAIRVLEVAFDPVDGRDADARLNDEIQQRGPFDVDVTTEVRLTIGTVADELAAFVTRHPGSTIVMSSHGKGRSAAIVGSVTEELLHRTFGPIVLVGPNVEPNDFSGPIIVTVDGSQESEAALPLAAAWANELRTTPWIVHAIAPSAETNADNDAFDSNYTARLAKNLRSFSGHAVEFDALHDRNPERAVPDYASTRGASMIMSSSHGRSGLSRLVMGSVTAGFVRTATCPVALIRLPHPADAINRERMWAY